MATPWIPSIKWVLLLVIMIWSITFGCLCHFWRRGHVHFESNTACSPQIKWFGTALNGGWNHNQYFRYLKCATQCYLFHQYGLLAEDENSLGSFDQEEVTILGVDAVVNHLIFGMDVLSLLTQNWFHFHFCRYPFIWIFGYMYLILFLWFSLSGSSAFMYLNLSTLSELICFWNWFQAYQNALLLMLSVLIISLTNA